MDETLRSTGKVAVHSNFVETSGFIAPASADLLTWRGDIGIAPGATTLGVVARLDPVKAHGVLLQAVQPLMKERNSLQIVFVGDGPELWRLKQQCRDLGFADRVLFTGSLPRHPNPHFLLDIEILPSLSEGQPNALLEAMAAARPIIATLVGGVPDLLEHEATALLVPPNDQASLRAAIRRFLSDEQLRRRCASAARQVAMDRYSEGPVVGGISSWYSDLVPGNTE